MVEEPGKERRQPLILDCNLWIELITKKECHLREKILTGNYSIIITSYMAVETLRVLKRLSSKMNISLSKLETHFWEFLFHDNITMNFKQVFTESLINEIKDLPEIKIIASLLDLERKDVPYIVAAFQYNAIFLTEDVRSLLEKRNLIKQKLNIEILSMDEFLKRVK